MDSARETIVFIINLNRSMTVEMTCKRCNLKWRGEQAVEEESPFRSLIMHFLSKWDLIKV